MEVIGKEVDLFIKFEETIERTLRQQEEYKQNHQNSSKLYHYYLSRTVL